MPAVRFDLARWRPRRDPRVAAVPGPLRPWVDDVRSLTARLERGGGPVTVVPLAEGWTRPHAGEARRLGLAPGQWGWRREVVLSGGGRQVYARTVASPQALRGAARLLPRLGPRPLGPWLFRGRAVRRSAVEVARLAGDEPLAERLTGHGLAAAGCWARRSALRAAGVSLLITEVFLGSATGGEDGDRR